MSKPKRETARITLQNALVAEVVEKGISAVNIAGIVKRAKVSAGTVYVHFDSKEDMLQQVYLQLKTDFHHAITKHRDEPDTAKMVRLMWFDMFDFVRERPLDFLFLEYASAAKILPPKQQTIVDGYAREIGQLLQHGVDDGTLAPVGTELLALLLIAPARLLARRAVSAGHPISQDMTTQTFDRVWLSIANNIT